MDEFIRRVSKDAPIWIIAAALVILAILAMACAGFFMLRIVADEYHRF